MSCWLMGNDGERVRVGRGGLVVGRRSDCGLVLADPGVSRRHALVRETPGGAEVVHLGKAPTRVNGSEIRDVANLAHGDLIEIGASTLTVGVGEGTDAAAARVWMLESPGKALYGVSRTPFVVGGGDRDDVVLEAWPAAAASFHPVQDSLVVELGAPGRVCGEQREVEESVSLRVGDTVEFGGLALSVLAAGLGTEGTTRVSSAWTPPHEVSLHFHARGGLLSLKFPHMRDDEPPVSVHLPDRRCDLVATLLKPPGGLKAGELVSDDVLAPRVWPGQPGKGRTDINLLLHRTRKSLVEAGVDGPALLERGAGGGETRLVVARRAKVSIS